ncbi:MAG: branched-chain amino acid ABC transporter permease [Actinomycetota bacterium]|nr:branched-chain amino acid ABC transporter permease [Actinomycetota bacterium]
MELTILTAILISGLATGAIYALAAEGLNLIWGVMRVVNLAHGELMMIGVFVSYALWSVWGINPLLAAIPAAVALFFVGLGLEKLFIRRVIGSPELISLLLTFGISIFITNIGVLTLGAEFRTIRFLDQPVSILGTSLPLNQLVMAAAAIALSLGMYVVLQRTRTGTAIRAVAIDRDMAQQVGINTKKIFGRTFALGAALAGVAGALVTPLVAFNPLIGQTYILTAFAVVVLGGMGNFLGALIAGLLIGIVEAGVAYTVSVQLSSGVVFLVIILTLLFRPTGILGARE